jgi:uncharacterized protein YecE (DUF72 family)
VGEIRIGTSGWHYKHWIGNFYPTRFPSSRMLAHYARHFDTVELNNTFYSLPAQGSVLAWRDDTPSHFRFAVKGSRFLTHMKKLNNAQDGLNRFLENVELLGPKLGPILFQLPPNWEINMDRLATFLDILPVCHKYVFEFRNHSWNTSPVYDLLARYNASHCIFDLARYLSPFAITADFSYIRLHGPGDKYQGSYSDSQLEEWAQKIGDWSKSLAAVYVYFDNDERGYAPQAALRLKALLHQNA